MLNTTKKQFNILLAFHHDLPPLLLLNSPCFRSYQMQHATDETFNLIYSLNHPICITFAEVKNVEEKTSPPAPFHQNSAATAEEQLH